MIKPVQLARLLRTTCIALLLTVFVSASALAAGKGTPKMRFSFNGQTYEHRWSGESQHEFTPVGQEDLEKWTDMVTITIFEGVVDADGLAETANRVLGIYESRHGKILVTNSIPATDDTPAEHFIMALLGNTKLLEANFARIMLADGIGISVVAAHRFYGDKAPDGMSPWLGENGQDLEATLKSWKGLPDLTVVREL